MNRTKVLSTVLSIALIASVGGNFYNYSQSKTLSNALYDSTKQVEALTQELEQNQLALEAANAVATGQSNGLIDESLIDAELQAIIEGLTQSGSKITLPDGIKRYPWDNGSLGPEYYAVTSDTVKSTAQYHQEYRKKFNISDSAEMDVTLNVFNDKNGDGVKDYIQEGRQWDYRQDIDPESGLYKDFAAADREGELVNQAIAEGRLEEHMKSLRPSTPFFK